MERMEWAVPQSDFLGFTSEKLRWSLKKRTSRLKKTNWRLKTLSYPKSHSTENAACPIGSTIQDFPITLNLKKTFEYTRTSACAYRVFLWDRYCFRGWAVAQSDFWGFTSEKIAMTSEKMDLTSEKNPLKSETLSFPESHPSEIAAWPIGSTIQDFPITLNLKKIFEYPRTLALIGFVCGRVTVLEGERLLSLTF